MCTQRISSNKANPDAFVHRDRSRFHCVAKCLHVLVGRIRRNLAPRRNDDPSGGLLAAFLDTLLDLCGSAILDNAHGIGLAGEHLCGGPKACKLRHVRDKMVRIDDTRSGGDHVWQDGRRIISPVRSCPAARLPMSICRGARWTQARRLSIARIKSA